MKKKSHPKMDRYLISNQVWEISYARIIFYKLIKSVISHPSTAEIKAFIKKHNNSRIKVYNELRKLGYSNITAK